MTLEDIYFECEQKGITVDYFKTDKAKAFSFPYENGIVVLDKSKIETTAEETVLLAHEEVHIDLGAFYLFTTPLYNILSYYVNIGSEFYVVENNKKDNLFFQNCPRVYPFCRRR